MCAVVLTKCFFVCVTKLWKKRIIVEFWPKIELNETFHYEEEKEKTKMLLNLWKQNETNAYTRTRRTSHVQHTHTHTSNIKLVKITNFYTRKWLLHCHKWCVLVSATIAAVIAADAADVEPIHGTMLCVPLRVRWCVHFSDSLLRSVGDFVVSNDSLEHYEMVARHRLHYYHCY